MRRTHRSPEKHTHARSYVIRAIYRRRKEGKKREEVEKNSRSRSKLIEIKGICARSPPINNFAGVQQQQPERKRGREEEKRKKKSGREGILVSDRIYIQLQLIMQRVIQLHDPGRWDE